MRKHFLTAMILGALAAPAAAQDCVPYTGDNQVPGEFIVSYHADWSDFDHFNSAGARLTTAAAVLQQDRANVHKYAKSTAYDQKDPYFTTLANRKKLGGAAVTSYCHSLPGAVRRAIVDGTTAGTVIFFKATGGGYVALVDMAG